MIKASTGTRRLLIGRTDGGRTLTLAIEQRSTDDLADHHGLGLLRARA